MTITGNEGTTVLDNIKPNMELVTEEAFSPVLPIQ